MPVCQKCALSQVSPARAALLTRGTEHQAPPTFRNHQGPSVTGLAYPLSQLMVPWAFFLLWLYRGNREPILTTVTTSGPSSLLPDRYQDLISLLKQKMSSQVQKHQATHCTQAISVSLCQSLSLSFSSTLGALTCHNGVGLWPRHAAPDVGRGGTGQVGLHVIQPSSQRGHR